MNSDSTSSDLNRFGISDLMLWTLFSALIYSLHPFDILIVDESLNAVLRVTQLLLGLAGGAQLAAAYAVLSRLRVHGVDEHMTQPGNWLLFYPAPSLSIQLLRATGHVLIGDADLGGLGEWAYPVAISISCIFWGYAAVCNQRLWRIVFSLAILESLSIVIYWLIMTRQLSLSDDFVSIADDLLIVFFPAIKAISVVFLLAVVFLDRQNWIRRTWPHWVGVFGYIFVKAIGFVFLVVRAASS